MIENLFQKIKSHKSCFLHKQATDNPMCASSEFLCHTWSESSWAIRVWVLINQPTIFKDTFLHQFYRGIDVILRWQGYDHSSVMCSYLLMLLMLIGNKLMAIPLFALLELLCSNENKDILIWTYLLI